MEENILILSAGTRDKVVQYFVKEFNGSGAVIATDCSDLAPAIYDADRFHIVPRIDAPGYIDGILDICRRDKIRGVFSLIDPELSMLARDRARFEVVGTLPIVSPYELVEECFDKDKMSEVFRGAGLKTARCYMSVEEFEADRTRGEIDFPVFVKPVCGSASININKVSDNDELETLMHHYDDLMIQEFMDGQEYGADCYIDLISGKCTSIFLKKKIRMRAGETDKSVSVVNEKLFGIIKNFVENAGFRGMIDIDLFDIDGEWYFSEVNPRFGGGYPHAYACGVNFPKQILNNLEGNENPVNIGDYEEGICMMKYNEVMFRKMQ